MPVAASKVSDLVDSMEDFAATCDDISGRAKKAVSVEIVNMKAALKGNEQLKKEGLEHLAADTNLFKVLAKSIDSSGKSAAAAGKALEAVALKLRKGKPIELDALKKLIASPHKLAQQAYNDASMVELANAKLNGTAKPLQNPDQLDREIVIVAVKKLQKRMHLLKGVISKLA